MNAALLGLATASPPRQLPQDRAMDLADGFYHGPPSKRRLMRALFRHSGVATRGLVVLDNPQQDHPAEFFPVAKDADDHGPDTASRMARYIAQAFPLAKQAAADALASAQVEPSEITHVITCSCTGFSAPGLEIRLLDALGIPPTVSRTNVGFMGCHGSFNAMALGRAIVAGDPHARVLVCSVELCSLHFAYGSDAQKWAPNALFADGAGAVVIGAEPSAHTPDNWRLADTGSCILPDSTDAMTWDISNHGFVMTLSPKVPEQIQTHLRGWLEPWLAKRGLAIADIGSWAIHPGGPRIVEAAEAAMGLPQGAAAASRQVLKNHGNMSSATILFVIQALQKAAAPRPCLALGFGPGLAAEVMLFR